MLKTWNSLFCSAQFKGLTRFCSYHTYEDYDSLTTLTGLEHCSKLWCQGSFAFLQCLLSSFPRYFLVIWIQILETNLRAGLRLGWDLQWPGSNKVDIFYFQPCELDLSFKDLLFSSWLFLWFSSQQSSIRFLLKCKEHSWETLLLCLESKSSVDCGGRLYEPHFEDCSPSKPPVLVVDEHVALQI